MLRGTEFLKRESVSFSSAAEKEKSSTFQRRISTTRTNRRTGYLRTWSNTEPHGMPSETWESRKILKKRRLEADGQICSLQSRRGSTICTTPIEAAACRFLAGGGGSGHSC